MVAATGLDPVDAQQVAARKPPLILAPMGLNAAKDAVRVLREMRVPCTAVRRADMEGLWPAFLAKRLVPGAAQATYVAEPWRPRLVSPRPVEMAKVVLIVRGRVAQSVRVTTVDVDIEPGTGGYGTMMDEIAESRVTVSRGTVQEMLDLYTSEGPPVRVSGKFDFTTVLGRDRAMTDRENMDRLAVRLGEQAPGATIDLNFQDFRKPGMALARGAGPRPKVARMAPSGATEVVTARDDMPAFDFYSAWVAILDSALRRGREQAARKQG